MVTDLELAGQAALEAAVAAWERGIVDPRRVTGDDESRAFIDTIIRDPAKGLGWPRCSKRVQAYRLNGDFEWCGAFAAHAWLAAGLDRRLAFACFASTIRLDGYGRYARVVDDAAGRRALLAFPKPDDEPRRYLTLTESSKPERVTHWGPRAGDILLVTQPRYLPRYRYGSHVAIVERWDPAAGVFHTIEGNARGTLANGKVGEGVVRQVRKVGLAPDDGPETWHARRLIRPSPHDLTGE